MYPSRCVAAAALALVLGACATTPTAPTGGRSAMPATPAPEARRPVAELQRVVVDQVEIGAGPREETDTVVVTPGALLRNDPVWVLDATSDGEWYLVVAGTSLDALAASFGWIPQVRDGRPTLGSTELVCPDPPLTVEQLIALGAFGGLACFGPEPITFAGFTPIGCGIGGSPRTGTPEWLNGTWSGIGIGAEEPQPPSFEVELSVGVRAAPGLDFDPCGSTRGWYRLIGHFDDPASTTCRTETTTPDGTRQIIVEPMLSQVLCRSQLVVTQMTRLADAP